MPYDLTATVVPTTPVPYVLLQLADIVDDGVQVTIERTPEGDVPGGVVRGTPIELDAGGAVLTADAEYPLGVDLTYRASVVYLGVEISAPTVNVPAPTYDVAGMVVSNPVNGTAVPVVVLDERGARKAWRGSRIDLAGYPVPVIVSDQHRSWEWTDVWGTSTIEQHDQLAALLTAGQPLLLRLASPGCALRTGFVHVGDVESERWTVPASDPRRQVTAMLTAVDPVPSTIETQTTTLLDLHEYEPTDLLTLSTRPPVTLLQLSVAVATSASVTGGP